MDEIKEILSGINQEIKSLRTDITRIDTVREEKLKQIDSLEMIVFRITQAIEESEVQDAK